MNTGNPRPRYTSFSQISAYMATAQGYPCVPLYAVGSDGNDSNIIAYVGRNAVGNVTAYGPVAFTRVTPTQWGTVASAAGTSIVMAAGYSWTDTKGSFLSWDATGASEDGCGLYTRVGDTLTVPAICAAVVAAWIAAGKTVRVYSLDSEFTIGGSTRDVTLTAGASCSFGATGLVIPQQTSYFYFNPLPGWVHSSVTGAITLGANVGDGLGIGWRRDSVVQYQYYGFYRHDVTASPHRGITWRSTTNSASSISTALEFTNHRIDYNRNGNAIGTISLFGNSQTIAAIVNWELPRHLAFYSVNSSAVLTKAEVMWV